VERASWKQLFIFSTWRFWSTVYVPQARMHARVHDVRALLRRSQISVSLEQEGRRWQRWSRDETSTCVYFSLEYLILIFRCSKRMIRLSSIYLCSWGLRIVCVYFCVFGKPRASQNQADFKSGIVSTTSSPSLVTRPSKRE
jgi:hypothetical protein